MDSPERGAQDVEVAGRLDGRDVRGQRAGARHAAGPEGVDEVGVLAALGGGVRVRVGGDVLVELPVAEAVDRRAGAGAPRVEADDVVARQQRLAQGRPGLGGVVGAGHAGPARVHHQRADPGRRPLRGGPEHGQVDRLAAGVGVVERHPQGGALELVAAVRPAQRLAVVVRRGRGSGAPGGPGARGWWSAPGPAGRTRARRARARRARRRSRRRRGRPRSAPPPGAAAAGLTGGSPRAA